MALHWFPTLRLPAVVHLWFSVQKPLAAKPWSHKDLLVSLVPGIALGTHCSKKWQGMTCDLATTSCIILTYFPLYFPFQQPTWPLDQWISARRNKMPQTAAPYQRWCSVLSADYRTDPTWSTTETTAEQEENSQRLELQTPLPLVCYSRQKPHPRSQQLPPVWQRKRAQIVQTSLNFTFSAPPDTWE